jgi:serine protease Do
MDRWLLRLILASTLVAVQSPVAQPLSYNTERLIQDATFEFVALADNANSESLIGTAFAIGPNEFATAAHLLNAAVGSHFGPPQLIDSRHVRYRIRDILQFSEQHDYAIVSLEQPPIVKPLTILHSDQTTHDLYFAGWQANGQIVIKHATLAGMTPDEGSGEFDWLRFSGPVWRSLGGAPLLDHSGQVVGIVAASARDAGANYAAPIGLLPVGAPTTARIHATEMLRSLMPAVSSVEPLKGEIPLPVSFEEFSHELQQLRLAYFDRTVAPLLEATRGNFVVTGAGAAEVCNLLNGQPCQCKVRAGLSGSLVLDSPGTDELLTRIARGEEVSQTVGGVVVARTRQLEASPKLVSRKTTDQEEVYTDFHNRTWSLRTWRLEHQDRVAISLERPLADGYVVLTRALPTALRYAAALQVKFVANLVHYGCEELPGEGVAQVAQDSSSRVTAPRPAADAPDTSPTS